MPFLRRNTHSMTEETPEESYDAKAYIPDGRWKVDANCAACDVKFSYFHRRHHCRYCGVSVCDKHSRKRAVLPTSLSTHLQRVCDRCYPICVSAEGVINRDNDVVKSGTPRLKRTKSSYKVNYVVSESGLKHTPGGRSRHENATLDYNYMRNVDSDSTCTTQRDESQPNQSYSTRNRSHTTLETRRVNSDIPNVWYDMNWEYDCDDDGDLGAKVLKQTVTSLNGQHKTKDKSVRPSSVYSAPNKLTETTTSRDIHPREKTGEKSVLNRSGYSSANESKRRQRRPLDMDELRDHRSALMRAQLEGKSIRQRAKSGAGQLERAKTLQDESPLTIKRNEKERRGRQNGDNRLGSDFETAKSQKLNEKRNMRSNTGLGDLHRTPTTPRSSRKAREDYSTTRIDRLRMAGMDVTASTGKPVEETKEEKRARYKEKKARALALASVDPDDIADVRPEKDAKSMDRISSKPHDITDDPRQSLGQQSRKSKFLKIDMRLLDQPINFPRRLRRKENETDEERNKRHKEKRHFVRELNKLKKLNLSKDESEAILADINDNKKIEWDKLGLPSHNNKQIKKDKLKKVPEQSHETTENAETNLSSSLIRVKCTKSRGSRSSLENSRVIVKSSDKVLTTRRTKPPVKDKHVSSSRAIRQDDKHGVKRCKDYKITRESTTAESNSDSNKSAPKNDKSEANDNPKSNVPPLEDNKEVMYRVSNKAPLAESLTFKISEKLLKAQTLPAADGDSYANAVHVTNPSQIKLAEKSASMPTQDISKNKNGHAENTMKSPEQLPISDVVTDTTISLVGDKKFDEEDTVDDRQLQLAEQVMTLEETIVKHQTQLIELHEELDKSRKEQRSLRTEALDSKRRVKQLLKARSTVNHGVRKAQSLLKEEESFAAILELARPIDIDPSSCQAWLLLAECRMNIGELDAAETSCRKCIELGAGNKGYALLGRILHKLGRYDEAVNCYMKALGRQEEKRKE